MIDAGEDPKFIARRMVILRVKTLGWLAMVLSLAVATFQAVERVGLPEANYNLFHCAMALARSEKSREVSDLMYDAKDFSKKIPLIQLCPYMFGMHRLSLWKILAINKNYKWKAGFTPTSGFCQKMQRINCYFHVATLPARHLSIQNRLVMGIHRRCQARSPTQHYTFQLILCFR